MGFWSCLLRSAPWPSGGDVLINLDHFLAGRIHIPSGCCHLVGSSACLFYLHDKRRAVYTQACRPGHGLSVPAALPAASQRAVAVLQSACGGKKKKEIHDIQVVNGFNRLWFQFDWIVGLLVEESVNLCIYRLREWKWLYKAVIPAGEHEHGVVLLSSCVRRWGASDGEQAEVFQKAAPPEHTVLAAGERLSWGDREWKSGFLFFFLSRDSLSCVISYKSYSVYHLKGAVCSF